MRATGKTRGSKEESGIALLLSIFVLLLVCVVGIAMMSASGTEVSLTGNYRSSTATYYAAISGLEEARGRLLPKNPSYLSGYIPPYGSTLALGHVIYIRNPLPGDPVTTIAPRSLGNPATFPDTNWAREFPSQNPPSSVQYVTSVPTITSPPNTPNPPYKWVRINALTEYAIQTDVNYTSGNTSFNRTSLVYFDGNNLTRTATPYTYQALGITALAALPDGSRKLLQYVVGPVVLQAPIAAALTLAGPGTVGNVISFNPPGGAASFYIKGTDLSGTGPNNMPPTSCSAQTALPAVGVYTSNDYTSVDGSLSTPASRAGHYQGAGGTTPNVSELSHSSLQATMVNFNLDMTDALSLANYVQLITNSADVVLTGPATQANMPSGMTPSNPMTVVVNGDLTLNSFTGYGLLVVTGTLNYTADSGWRGIVLVIGQGVMNENASAPPGEFDGAVFIANTTPGTSLGPASYSVSSSSGNGIYYNSCWINASLKPVSYKILAFHEIPYP